jgi:LysM repeat protein
MRVVNLLLCITFGLIAIGEPLFSDAQQSVSPAIKMQHTLQNLETEVTYLKQRISNQESTIDSLRDELSALIKATKELQTKSASTQDGRIAKIEKSLEKVVADLKQFKTHANETGELVAEVKNALDAQYKASQLQNKEMQDFERALKSLAQAMQKNISLPEKQSVARSSSSDCNYRVQSGDTLEKIAKDLRVSISTLKECNNLKSDKIVIGQELKIPDGK